MKAKTNMSTAKTTQTVRKIDIAKACGVSFGTVNNILNDCGLKYAPATVDLVKKTAKEMGFVHGMCGAHQRSKWDDSLPSASGNFATRGEETARMLYLRNEELCTNAQIAKKVGLSHNAVLNRIGKQPKELTHMSCVLRDERKARSKQLRRNLILKRKIAQFEQFQQEANEINARAAELEAQAQRIADEAKAVREQYSSKVIELNQYRVEAEKAAKELGRSLA